MVDASHTPNEPGSEDTPAEDMPAEEKTKSASEAADIFEGNESETPIRPEIEARNFDSASETIVDPQSIPVEREPSAPSLAEPVEPEDQAELPISDTEEGLILEERSEEEGPYTSTEDFVDLSESTDDEATDVVEPESEAFVDVAAEEGHAETPAVESDGAAIADQDVTESTVDAADTLPPAVDAASDSSAEAEDWDLGELETTADAADAAKLATQSQAAGNSPIQRIQALIQSALKLWRQLLRGVRSRLPQVASLSDWVLSGILIGSFVLLLIVINRLGVSSPAAAPPTTPPAAVETSPAPATDLEAPSPEAPVNPDLARIAEIQDQLAAVATSYASNLVVSVQASFAEDRLSTNLSSGWYRLSRDQQDQLAADLLGRSQTLEFATLELIDPDGSMVARSPVVGKTMVIMQRQPPPEVPIPERPRYRITIDR